MKPFSGDIHVVKINEVVVDLKDLNGSDLSSIYDLMKILAKEEAIEDQLKTKDDYIKHMLDLSKENQGFVIFLTENTEMIAVAVVNRRLDFIRGNEVNVLDKLIIHPNYRNLKIGKFLMNKIQEISKNVLEFKVLKSNENAIRFYTRHGCVEQERWSLFSYSGGVDDSN